MLVIQDVLVARGVMMVVYEEKRGKWMYLSRKKNNEGEYAICSLFFSQDIFLFFFPFLSQLGEYKKKKLIFCYPAKFFFSLERKLKVLVNNTDYRWQ